MKDSLSTHSKTNAHPPIEPEQSVIPILKLNPDEYREYLKDFDMSEEQQNELLETLWHIMRTFVELGWGLDTIQLFSNEEAQDSGNEPINPLSIKDNPHTFNQAVNHPKRQEKQNDTE